MISTIIKCIIEWFTTFYFITTLNQVFKKDAYSKKTKIQLFFGCLLIVSTYFIPKSLFPLNSIIGTLLYLLVCIFIINKKIVPSILQSISYMIYLFLCEAISITLLLYFVKYESADALLATTSGQIAGMSIYHILNILGILALNFILKKREELAELTNFFVSKQFASFITIILFTLLPQICLMVYNRYQYDIGFLVFNIIQIIVLSIYMVYSIYTFLQREKFKKINNELEVDNKAMANLIDGVRTIKHDFNNIFQAIHGYICTKDYTKLETYVNSVMKECSILNNITFLNKDIFDDSGIYGVVGAKQFYANNIGILFDIDVTTKVSEINFSMPQLSRIFGILLDNAIEATQKADEKYVKLEIQFNKLKNSRVIKIYNTYDKSINIDLNKIYEKGYSSKKVKSGIGLWEVKKLIDHSKNSQIFASFEEDYFVQNIIIEN